MNFGTYRCFTLVFISDQSVHIKINESMLFGKLFGNLFSEFVAVGSWSDMNDGGFDVNVYVGHCLFETLNSIYFDTVGVAFQERN